MRGVRCSFDGSARLPCHVSYHRYVFSLSPVCPLFQCSLCGLLDTLSQDKALTVCQYHHALNTSQSVETLNTQTQRRHFGSLYFEFRKGRVSLRRYRRARALAPRRVFVLRIFFAAALRIRGLFRLEEGQSLCGSVLWL